MSALSTLKQYPKADRHHIGKLRKRASVPFYSIYAKGSDIGCGHQHKTLEQAEHCCENLATAHRGTEYQIWEITPGTEVDRTFIEAMEGIK